MSVELSAFSAFPLVAPEDLTDPLARDVYAEIERELGFGIVPNVFRAMASNPEVLAANWRLFRAVVLNGRLPRMLKEMVGVVVSVVHQSDYARLVHLHSLGVQGVSPEALAALANGQLDVPELSPSTLAVLRFAWKATSQPASLTPSDYAALAEAGLDQADTLEVLGAIQLFSAVNLFTDTASVPVDAI